MDCLKTQPQLTAFHDGELPDADRVRVEEHLRGCPGCRALLADLARADEAAGVPDPGPGYWDRFNARLEDRIEREAEGPRVAVLRPKQGWMRQQLRFLVPAVAAAALVVVVVRYGGLNPGAPTPTIPQAVSEPAGPDSAGQRVGKAELEPPATEKKKGAAV
ncbi:MAG: zf-HC2 domain-containing protein, partial [Candidatus Deferrimicrobiota bacterium]